MPELDAEGAESVVLARGAIALAQAATGAAVIVTDRFTVPR
jgi:hypothetical protein